MVSTSVRYNSSYLTSNPAYAKLTLTRAVANPFPLEVVSANALRKLAWGSVTRVCPPSTTSPVIEILDATSHHERKTLHGETYNTSVITLTMPMALDNLSDHFVLNAQPELDVSDTNHIQ